MDSNTDNKVRIFRKREAILEILNEQKNSSLSIKTFCEKNNLASASFHNWKKRYGNDGTARPGFTKLQITTPAAGSVLFAEVYGIKIYQPVSAAYLKELLS
jgi:hypothetical protein